MEIIWLIIGLSLALATPLLGLWISDMDLNKIKIKKSESVTTFDRVTRKLVIVSRLTGLPEK